MPLNDTVGVCTVRARRGDAPAVDIKVTTVDDVQHPDPRERACASVDEATAVLRGWLETFFLP